MFKVLKGERVMEVRKNLVDKSKWGLKCPYSMNATRYVVHNTANDASAENEIAYMRRNNNEVSFHYAIDDKEVVQGIEENRNAWASGDGGNGKGNREGIHIEICYSKSGGERFIQAEKNTARFIAEGLKAKGWGIDKVTKHQDYSGKYCPHRTLDMGWQRFLNMIQDELNKLSNVDKPQNNVPQQSNSKVDVMYRVKTLKHGWLPFVKNLEDYAGWENSPIIGLALKVSKGSVKYRVHVKGGKWLGWVTDCNLDDYYNGYAGNNKPIDAIQIYYYTPNDIRPYKKAKYKVNNYAWQHDIETSNGQDGYAGDFGVNVTKLRVTIE